MSREKVIQDWMSLSMTEAYDMLHIEEVVLLD